MEIFHISTAGFENSLKRPELRWSLYEPGPIPAFRYFALTVSKSAKFSRIISNNCNPGLNADFQEHRFSQDFALKKKLKNFRLSDHIKVQSKTPVLRLYFTVTYLSTNHPHVIHNRLKRLNFHVLIFSLVLFHLYT
jgi:hypothetical protein